MFMHHGFVNTSRVKSGGTFLLKDCIIYNCPWSNWKPQPPAETHLIEGPPIPYSRYCKLCLFFQANVCLVH